MPDLVRPWWGTTPGGEPQRYGRLRWEFPGRIQLRGGNVDGYMFDIVARVWNVEVHLFDFQSRL